MPGRCYAARAADRPSTIARMDDAADRAARSARELARRIGTEHHDVLVVLGSGLSGAAELLGAGRGLPPARHPPLLPALHGGGHRAHGWSVAAGRAPGPGPRRALPPLRGARRRPRWSTRCAPASPPGCTTVILTAAAGGIRADLATGIVMVVEDHLNLTGRSPLSGPGLRRHGRRLRARACARWRWRRRTRRRAASGRPAGRLRAAPGPAVRDAGRGRACCATARRRRRRHVHGARDDRRPRTPAPTSSAWRWSPTRPRPPATPHRRSRPSPAVGRRRGARRGRHRPPRRRLAAVTNPVAPDRRRPRRHQRARRPGRHRLLHRDARPGAEPHPARLRLPRRLAGHGQRAAGPPDRGGGAPERRPALRAGLRRPRRGRGRAAARGACR